VGTTATLQTLQPFPRKLAVKPNVYVGTLGVFLGAGIATLFGRLLSVGLPDLRGALGLSIDEAAWLPTAYNMTLMFMGPFSVYLGALLGARRVFCGLPRYSLRLRSCCRFHPTSR
jgi:predicted MFS family arabinose efflux permease